MQEASSIIVGRRVPRYVWW